MLSNMELNTLRDLLEGETGIQLGPDKRYLYEQRLTEEARRCGQSVPQFLGRLRDGQVEAINQFVSAMTTHETLFFRELSSFNALRTKVLPDLLEQRKSQRELRIWSVACSTGQEPYSLMMLLRSYFPQLSNWNIHFLATDVSQECIQRGQLGRYTQWEVNRGLPITKLLRYFRQDGDDWLLEDEIRKQIRFERQNILNTSRGNLPYDLILCRNLLIYFDSVTKKRILRILQEHCANHGFFFIGNSEHSPDISDHFTPIYHDSTIYYQPRNRRSENQQTRGEGIS